MGRYFRYFRWHFFCVGVLAVIYAGILLLHGSADAGGRGNGECLTGERVFDYGEVLSEEEEEKLRQLIARRERQTGCDIILVTLDESLEGYAREREANVPWEEFVRVYAEEFYDRNRFGYNKPIGDGVLLVDNWHREADGNVYTWLCTVGKADEKYNLARMEHLLDQVYRYVEKNPYKAYKAYIEGVYHDMTGNAMHMPVLSWMFPLGMGCAAMLFFAAIHWKGREGKKTVTAVTYVNGGKPCINKKEDILLHRTVTQRKIQKGAGSGSRSGGGGSSSHSHGGHHGGAGRHR